MRFRAIALLTLIVCLISNSRQATAQSIGIELHATTTPAAGAMGGVAMARPQDNIAALGSNPATLTQYSGTNFTMGGAWLDSDFRIAYDGVALPNVTPFNDDSNRPGSLLGDIAVSQELDVMGVPVVWSSGLLATAGAGIDFRRNDNTNGTNSSVAILELASGFGVNLTDDLAVGGAFWLGTATFDGPFVGIGGSTVDYGVRGSLGMTYNLGTDTTVGAHYYTRQDFTFHDAVLLDNGAGFDGALNVNMDLPQTVGVGIANSSLMDGDLLLAVDVLWKNWEDADLMNAIYRDQWAVQFGTQLTRGQCKLRAGYVWAQNPLRTPAAGVAGGIPLVQEAVQYLQAQFAVINQHRLSGGVGVEDVLPGVDLDLFGGGAFQDSQRLGATRVQLFTYWVGFGMTWHFDGAKTL